jgi:hypothetical protein
VTAVGPAGTVVAGRAAGADEEPDADGAWLGGLAGRVLDLGAAPVELLQRTLMAIAVLHEPDERGRCPACRPRWQLPGRRGGCTTRGLLWLAVTEGTATAWRPA